MKLGLGLGLGLKLGLGLGLRLGSGLARACELGEKGQRVAAREPVHMPTEPVGFEESHHVVRELRVAVGLG